MKNISINIDDAIYSQLVTAVTTTTNYQTTISDPQHPGQTIPNPETPDQRVQKVVGQYLTSFLANFLAKQAGIQAQAQAKQTLQAGITVTTN